MKIRTLKNDAHCLVEFRNGRYEVGGVCIDDCCFDADTYRYIKNNSSPKSCITQSIGIGEKFFFSMLRFYNKRVDEKNGNIGFISKDKDTYILNIDEIIEGNKLYPESHHRFLVIPYFPRENFFNNNFSRSIITSDGVITLEDDQFVGVRDGNIEEIDANELLEIISRYSTKRSAIYESIRLQPISKRPLRPRKGTIIYNKNKDKLEYYNGKDWREI